MQVYPAPMMQQQMGGQPMMMQQQPMMMQQQPMMMQQQPMMQQPMMQQPMMQQQPMMMQQQPMMMQQPMAGQTAVMMQQPMMAQPMMMGQQMMMQPQYNTNPYAVLELADVLIVDEQINLMEAITGIEGKNKYKIYTRHGLQFFAHEESSFCGRCFCGPNVEAKVYFKSMDQFGPNMFLMEKPFMCCCPALLPFCQKESTFKEVNGNAVGYFQVPMFGGCCVPTVDMYDKSGGTKIGQLTGPCCCIGGLCDSKFTVTNATGVQVATFQRMGVDSMGDAARMMLTSADRYSMQFAPNVDPRLKANLLGMIIFLDYLFFEGDGVCTPKPGGGCRFRVCSLACCGQAVPCTIETGGSNSVADGF